MNAITDFINWSKKQYSHLPWRVNRSMYTTLVSEIMLQQTTVATVENHFARFLVKYPTLKDLAQSSEEEILIQWKGLGYYRRARNLLRAAKEIVKTYDEQIPDDIKLLKDIHGIGDYTASALRSIGANKKSLAIDANIERVVARLYALSEPKGLKLQKKIAKLFEEKEILTEFDACSPRDLNEAFMDLGRSICKARSASCEICPLSILCQARNKNPLDYPKQVESQKTKESFDLHLLRVIVEKDNSILAYQKKSDEWLTGQFEIPTFIIECEDHKLNQYPRLDNDIFFNLPIIRTGITKYKIFNYVLFASESELKKISTQNKTLEWISNYSLLSTTSKKVLQV